MIGAALFGILDVRHRRTQLHSNRIDKVEQVIAPGYRLRPSPNAKGSRWPIWMQSQYGSTLSFYAVVLILLLVLLIVP